MKWSCGVCGMPVKAAGPSLCPEHRAFYEAGFTAIVEAERGDEPCPFGATRVAFIRDTVWGSLFRTPLIDDEGRRHPFVYCEPAAFDWLESTYMGGKHGAAGRCQ